MRYQGESQEDAWIQEYRSAGCQLSASADSAAALRISPALSYMLRAIAMKSYTSYYSTFTEPRLDLEGRPVWGLGGPKTELNSMTLTVIFFLPVSDFKPSAARSFTPFLCSFNAVFSLPTPS